jgi:exopolyphosphatase/guanosine-5'-triphosphate,3'-diphosphate pyrophosphatase
MDAASECRAVIDIGSNSVKLLVAHVRDGAVDPVWEQGLQTRLGRGLQEAGRILPGAIADTVAAVGGFLRTARERGAGTVGVVATSAVRDAANGHELVDAVRDATGTEVEVISGETEAAWSFAGVCTDPELASRRLLVLDVGGGSTEFVVGERGRTAFAKSVRLGSVRLLESLRPPDAPSPSDLAAARARIDALIGESVLPDIAPHLATPVDLAVGVGGSTAILAMIRDGTHALDRRGIESARFASGDLAALVERLWSLPLAERRRLPGLPPERADVILAGAAIYEAILRVLRPPVLAVSTRGLRWTALIR